MIKKKFKDVLKLICKMMCTIITLIRDDNNLIEFVYYQLKFNEAHNLLIYMR